MDVTAHTGQCLCGAVTFRASGKPNWVGHCHCRSCRRNSASAIVTYVGFAPAAVRWSGEPRRFFASSPGVRRGFCERCGTPLSYESEQFENEVHLYLNTFDEPASFTPTFHVFYAEHVPWLALSDGLPRYSGTTSSPTVDD